MAIVVDQESSYKGERKVRNAIAECFSDDNVVYNNREVNGREYDICILMKDMAIFIVEVKGWLSNKIKVHGVDDIEVEGYEMHQTSPKKQAKSYCMQYVSKLKKRYTVAPLVVDLVAYPFITKEEYYNTHLNIISEEQFTIFCEDLENHSLLREKFHMAYDAKKTITHSELDAQFINRIRKNEEPEYEEPAGEEFFQAYSITSIFPSELEEERIRSIVSHYFKGIKQILFVDNRATLTIERLLSPF